MKKIAEDWAPPPYINELLACTCLNGVQYGPLDGNGDEGEACPNCEAGLKVARDRLAEAFEAMKKYQRVVDVHIRRKR